MMSQEFALTRRTQWIGIGLLSVMLVIVSWGFYSTRNSKISSEGVEARDLQSRLTELDLLGYPEMSTLAEAIRSNNVRERISYEKLLPPLLQLLIHRSGLVRGRAARALGEYGKEKAIPYLVMALQFELIFSGGEDHIAALQAITGHDFGGEWRRWYEEWWADPKSHPPEGFEEWLIALYTSFIPSFKDFLQRDVARTVGLHEVMWGQVIKDEIEALDHPPMVSPTEAGVVLLEDEMVFGVYVNGEARAYPLRYLDVHELVNDTVGGRPIMISFCTLCGSALLYDREVEGVIYSFGNSGLLYRGNKLMFDRTTNTLWSNVWGKAVIGPLSAKELKLKRYPLDQLTWGEWKELHPATKVLTIQAARIGPGRLRIPGGDPYQPGSAYREYRTDSDAIYPVAQRDQRLPPKAWVFGLIIQGQAKAYPMSVLAQNPAINDALAGVAIVLLTERTSLRMDLWNQGQGVRAYERATHIFRVDDSGVLLDEERQSWERGEEALVNLITGEKLDRIAGLKAYWFAWYEFYPETHLYQTNSDGELPQPCVSASPAWGAPAPSRSEAGRLSAMRILVDN